MRVALGRFAGACALAALLAGCGGATTTAAKPESTLGVLAGSELKDLEPFFGDIEHDTGVRIVPTYVGTIAGADRIASGDKSVDVAWFAQDKYLSLADTGHHVIARERVMISPVIFGVKESKAKAFGWTGHSGVTWRQIADKASSGALHYAMTNPTTSNTGFSAVIGVASAFAGKGDALRPSDIDAAKLTGFFSGQKLVAGSSGWLAEAYLREQDGLDGIINYEASLISLNADPALKEKLVLLYPKDGFITADYPLDLVNAAKRDAYDKVIAYLKSPAVQTKIMNATHRRPVDSSVPLASDIPKALLVDLPFPATLATVNGLLTRYLNHDRIPPHTFYVIDTSGSMEGSRLASVRAALGILAGTDDSATGAFARFEDRELITLISFSESPQAPVNFAMHRANDPATFAGVKSYAAGLVADGNTAIFGALEEALDEAGRARSADAHHYDSIVLMTDGENNRGDDWPAFEVKWKALPAAERAIKIFPVFIGEANPEQLGRVATLTGGRAFDARSEPLPAIFKEIRGYQ